MRWAHRRAFKRLALGVIVAIVVTTTMVNRAEVAHEDVLAVAVPEGHRVVSVPIDEKVPPLVVGDEVDIYLAPTFRGGLESDAEGVGILAEPGVVVSMEGESLAVAVPEDVIGSLVASLAEDAVLIVRR